MTTFDPHPFSKLFPPISEEDFGKLAADIKLNGLHQPIVRYQGKILDGNNRYRACELVKIAPKFADFNGDDAQARNYVISANIHRRHLSPDQRRGIIAALLKADPSQSNRQIGEQTKTSHHTVEAVRTEMEATGQIAQLDKTTGADGKTRKRTKSTTPEKEKIKIEYNKPFDRKSATAAYHLHEEHLLDVLQDIGTLSSPGHAVEYGEATIKRLQERIDAMQDEEEEDEEKGISESPTPSFLSAAEITSQFNYSCPSNTACSFVCSGGGLSGTEHVTKLTVYLGTMPLGNNQNAPALFYDFSTRERPNSSGFSISAGLGTLSCQVNGLTLDYVGRPSSRRLPSTK